MGQKLMKPSHHPEKESEKIGRAALTVYFSISKKWSLTPEQQIRILGDIPRSTFYNWKNKVGNKENLILARDTLERISYVMGIFKALNILLPSEASANEWIHRENSAPLFNNQSALDKMLAGNVADLADIRRFLDAYRGF
jgi:hypothetical protein